MSGMTTCSPPSSWYPDTRTRNGAAPPKPKASVRRTRSSSDTSITPLTATAGPRLTTSAKGKQEAKAFKAKNEGTGSIPGVLDVPTDESEEELSWNSTDDEGKDGDGNGDEEDEGDDGEEGDGDDDEDDDGEEGNGEEEIGLNVGGEEGHVKEEKENELYKDVNINQGRGIQATLEVEDSHVTLTSINPDGFDPQLLVEHFNPVEDNTSMLESDVLDDSTCLMFLEDVSGSTNLSFFTLCLGVIAAFFALRLIA
uniref:Uncharacterized protein n=1 Tax=Tanacetum cinerariifolium TaxID=118510 RepID=A0A699H4W7_TANCI|nr:hypothetical protein [Tanacetum cinerariifolium]